MPGNFCHAATEKKKVDTSGRDKKASIYTHFPKQSWSCFGRSACKELETQHTDSRLFPRQGLPCPGDDDDDDAGGDDDDDHDDENDANDDDDDETDDDDDDDDDADDGDGVGGGLSREKSRDVLEQPPEYLLKQEDSS